MNEYAQKKETYGAWEYYLGLEHTDSSPKRSHQVNQVTKKSMILVVYFCLTLVMFL